MKNSKIQNRNFWLNANFDNLEMIDDDQLRMLKGGDGDGVIVEEVVIH